MTKAKRQLTRKAVKEIETQTTEQTTIHTITKQLKNVGLVICGFVLAINAPLILFGLPFIIISICIINQHNTGITKDVFIGMK